MYSHIQIFFYVSLLVLAANASDTCNTTLFPSDFKFGAGTAAYQIEGGWNADGKGRSWWDWFMNTFPLYNRNVTGNVACDSYHKYEEDVALMKEIGLDFYRFSLSWSRILPQGFTNKVNQAGVDYYNNLINALIEAGIEPVVTIYHWDSPLALDHLGTAWTTPKMVDYFVAYADLAFSLFGDRVKLWATVNEPKSFCQGIPDLLHTRAFPEYPIGTLEYLCGHHVLLAHAKVYKLYQENYKATQNGRIAIAMDLNYHMPLTNSTEDQEAVEQANAFDFGWFAHTLVYGDYPEIMKNVIGNNSARQNFSSSRLPRFSCSERSLLKGSFDLLMVNTYTANYIHRSTYDNSPSYINDQQIAESNSDDWPSSALYRIYPWGIRHILNYVKDNYNNPEIIISENGYSDSTGTVNDTSRIEFLRDTLHNVLLAKCEDGVNVNGYSYWSFLDNLEWSRGYGIKFGMVQVDFDSDNRTRTLKNSGYYYGNLIQTRNVNLTET